MSTELYNEDDEEGWTEISSFSGSYQQQFNQDGRWRWRPRAKSTDVWPQPWQPGKPPKEAK